MHGEVEGARVWDAMKAKDEDAWSFTKVRERYAALTCAQAAFKPLKDGEDRAKLVRSARFAAQSLGVVVPHKLGLAMEALAPTMKPAEETPSASAASGD